MKHPKSKQSEKGFTLVEVMVAMFIFTFIVGEMFAIFQHSSDSNIFARRLTSANMVADRAIEAARNTDYSKLNLLAGTKCFDVHLTELACGGGDVSFTQVMAVTADTPLANMTQMDVTVTWTDRQGTDHPVRLVSSLSKI